MKLTGMFKRLEVKDERIKMETNRIASRIFPLELMLLFIIMIVKFTFFNYTIVDYTLEITILIVISLHFLIHTMYLGIPFTKSIDENIRVLQENINAINFYITSGFLVFGEFLIILINKGNVANAAWYIPVWFIPNSIYTVLSIKRGLLLWGATNKKKQNTISSFKKRVVVGSLAFGIFMGWDQIVVDGCLRLTGILKILLISASWGIPFYFIMKTVLKISHKNADDQVDEE